MTPPGETTENAAAIIRNIHRPQPLVNHPSSNANIHCLRPLRMTARLLLLPQSSHRHHSRSLLHTLPLLIIREQHASLRGGHSIVRWRMIPQER